VLIAIVANAGIAVAKGIAAAMTGSASLTAETIHSAVDTSCSCARRAACSSARAQRPTSWSRAREDAKVHAVRRLLTMHLGPGEVLVNIDLELAEDLRSVDVHATIADFERTVRKRHPNVRLIFIETDVARAPEP